MRTALFLLALTAGACGGAGDDDDDDDLAPFASGSRLRAIYRDGGAGAVLLSGWHDTELDVTCRFMTADDGVVRCLPTQGAGILFLDSACTDRAASWGTTCSQIPAFLHAGSFAVCAPGFHVSAFEVGSSTETDTTWTLDPDGTCREQPIGEGTQTVYRLTQLPPERFVAATPRHVDVGGGLGVEVLETEDGASAIGGLVDSADDRACSPLDLSPGETVCVAGPIAYGFSDYHTDPSCSNADVVSGPAGAGCEVPEIAAVYHPDPSDECGVMNGTLAQLGAELEATDLYAGMGADQCQPVADDLGSRFYAVGDPLAAVPPAVTKGWLGTGRARLGYLATADGALLAPGFGDWRDDTLDRPCFVAETVSDGMRCLPDFGSFDEFQSFWADDSCATDRLVPTWQSPCEPDRLPATIGVHYATDDCASRVDEAYDLAEVYEGTVWVSSGAGDCNPQDPGEGQVMHRLGPAHDLADFAAIEEVTE